MNNGQRKRTAGFSLVEVMVGIAIGLVTVLVVSQVMQVAESRKRTSTSGADAAVNASLSLYSIERDGRNAGFGYTTVPSSVGCEVRAKYGATATRTFPLVPAMITDGANGAPDQVRFFASSKNGITLPTRISGNHKKDDASFSVDSDIGIDIGDMMVAVPIALAGGTWCTVFRVAGAKTANQVPHTLAESTWNQTAENSILPDGGYSRDDYLINLGSFVDRAYGIAFDANTGRYTLRLTEFNMAANTNSVQDLYPDVVQLQAVYGKETDSPSDNAIDEWSATAPANDVEWRQVRALRIALVTRSASQESQNVTLDGALADSTCDSDTPHPAAVCWRPDPAGKGVKINVNINNANPNWQRYRYRVVETTIPLRNMIWQQ